MIAPFILSALSVFMSASVTAQETKPRCLTWLESECTTLQKSDHGIRTILAEDGKPLTIRTDAKDPQTGASQLHVAYYRRLLEVFEKLPRDFKKAAKRLGYRKALKYFISEPAYEDMSFDRFKRASARRRIAEIHETVFTLTLASRLESIQPGYHRNKNHTREENILYFNQKRALAVEINKAILVGLPQWKRVEKAFDQAKSELLQWITTVSDISESLRTAWENDLKSVRLVFPGEVHTDWRLTDNAAYFFRDHVFTVQMLRVFRGVSDFAVLHELAHVLDQDRQLENNYQRSHLKEIDVSLSNHFCSQKIPASCPAAAWQKLQALKGTSPLDAPVIEDFQVGLPKARACLRETTLKPWEELLSVQYEPFVSLAKYEVESIYRKASLREDLTYYLDPNARSGLGPNADYLRPCGTESCECRSGDAEQAIFVMAYLCSDQKLSPEDRFNWAYDENLAINTRIQMEMALKAKDFSGSELLSQMGFSESTSERFADFVASQIWAKRLAKLNDLETRRAVFFAASSAYCDIGIHEDAAVGLLRAEKKRSGEPHSTDALRRREFLIPEIRDALQCDLDFKAKDCSM